MECPCPKKDSICLFLGKYYSIVLSTHYIFVCIVKFYSFILPLNCQKHIISDTKKFSCKSYETELRIYFKLSVPRSNDTHHKGFIFLKNDGNF